MNKVYVITVSTILAVSLLAGGLLSWQSRPKGYAAAPAPAPASLPSLPPPSLVPSLSPSPSPSAVPSPVVVPSRVSLTVPFIVQAPGGAWEQQIFQDGCEEAALLMAYQWLQGTTLAPEEAARAIYDLSAFEDKTYGQAADRSVGDTVQIMKEYFQYPHVLVKYQIGALDMRRQLARGNLVITPMNGRLLNNPYYNAPGPDKHMIVVTGYDDTTREFITNDPGTIHGENYRYPQDIFVAAIADYPTGNHRPVPEQVTAMIVVSPSENMQKAL